MDESVLRQVMPFSLQLLEEYWGGNKVLGVKILSKVLEKLRLQAQRTSQMVAPDLLRVIWTQLRASLAHRELPVVAILIPSILLSHQLLQSSSEAPSDIHVTFLLELLSECERSSGSSFRRVRDSRFLFTS